MPPKIEPKEHRRASFSRTASEEELFTPRSSYPEHHRDSFSSTASEEFFSLRSSFSDANILSSIEPAEKKILSQPKPRWWQFWKSRKQPESAFIPRKTNVEQIQEKIDKINDAHGGNPEKNLVRLQAISEYIVCLNTEHDKNHKAETLEEMTRAYNEYKNLCELVRPADSDHLTKKSILNRLSLLDKEQSLIFLERLKLRLSSKESEHLVDLLIEKINDPKRDNLNTLSDFISTYITERVFAGTLKNTVELFSDPKFQEFANKILLIDPKQDELERLIMFQDMPFVEQAIPEGQSAYQTGYRISEQLKAGQLRQEALKIELSKNERALAIILGQDTEISLKKLEAVQKELTLVLEALKQNQKRIAEVKHAVEVLLKENQYADATDISPEIANKRTALDAFLVALIARQDETTGIPKEIDDVDRTLNLVQRMKRTTVLKSIIKQKSTIQELINKRNISLKAIEKVIAGKKDPTKSEMVDFGIPKETVEKIPLKLETLRPLAGDLETNLKSLREQAKQLDTLFEQELLRLQDQDADPKLGKIPVDYWIPWLKDIVRDATGIGEDSRRSGQERTNVLVIDKLLADQGVSMPEAYEKLKTTLVQAFNLNNPKGQLEEFSRLLRLPKWIYTNPNLARELLGNIRLTLLELYASEDQSLFAPAIEYLKSDAWMIQIIGWSEEAKDESISPDCLAILDISRYAPILIAASKCKNSTLGNWLNWIPGGIGKIIGDAISGTVRGIATKALAQKTATAFPGIGQFIEAFNNMQAGEDPLEVSRTLVKRGALAEATRFIRNIYYLGFKKAFQEVGENFNSWKKHASAAEISARVLTEAAPIAVGVWLCTTGVGIVFGIPCIAFGVGMRWVNEHLFFRSTTEKVNADIPERRRKERRMNDERYSEFLHQNEIPPKI